MGGRGAGRVGGGERSREGGAVAGLRLTEKGIFRHLDHVEIRDSEVSQEAVNRVEAGEDPDRASLRWKVNWL